MRYEDRLQGHVMLDSALNRQQSPMDGDDYNTCLPAVGVVELEDGDVVRLHALLVKPPVAFVEAHLVDFIDEARVDDVHRLEVLAVDCARITQGKRGILNVFRECAPDAEEADATFHQLPKVIGTCDGQSNLVRLLACVYV